MRHVSSRSGVATLRTAIRLSLVVAWLSTDGKNVAARRHCKFIEVSALLDHRMDELLVGITRQIRLRKARPGPGGGGTASLAAGTGRRRSRPGDRHPGGGGGGADSDADAPAGCLQRAAVAAFRKLFRRRGPVEATSCDDLFVP